MSDKLVIEWFNCEVFSVRVDRDRPPPVERKPRPPVEAASTWLSRGLKRVSAAWVRGMLR